jgi:CRISPR-associated endonuclease Csn1
MHKRILGIDIGISSLGWALIDYGDEEDHTIVDTGVRIFTKAEHPKDGKSLALPRRMARSSRIRLKRKRGRKHQIKKLILEKSFITKEILESLFDGRLEDVWQLRKKGLDEKLPYEDIVRILIHLANHRGYQSVRKVDEKADKETGAVLTAIVENKKLLDDYRTFGEMIFSEYHDTKMRNTSGKYQHTPTREMLKAEVITLCKSQRELGNLKLDEDFVKIYCELAFTQNPFKSVEDMVGRCTFEKNDKRAPKNAPTFELFRAYTTLQNLKIIENFSERKLLQAEIETIIIKSSTTNKISYKTIRKLLKLEEEATFKGLNYFDTKTGEVKNPEGTACFERAGYHALKKVLQKEISLKNLDEIATIFSIEKEDKEIEKKLHLLDINQEDINHLIENISFKYFAHLSLTALYKILPIIQEGKRYDEAIKIRYPNSTQFDKNKLLPSLTKEESDSLTNPVVKRAFSQYRKLLNAIIRKYGSVDKIHFELTRELKKSHKDRQQIAKRQKEFRTNKESARLRAEMDGIDASRGKNLLKFRLYEEQNGFSGYSNTKIDIARLGEDKYVEIDHILPFSRSLDDSLANKILVFVHENQDKRAMTPFEYFGQNSSSEQWLTFVSHVKTNLINISKRKRDFLLKTNFDENSENEFKSRNLNDTAYMARFIKEHTLKHLAFKNPKDKVPVQVRSGSLTSMLRHFWGIGEKSRDNHLHHAVDAIILAFSTQSEVQKLSTIAAKRENFVYEKKEEKAKKVHFTPPLEHFSAIVEEKINTIFVSHAPRHKVMGAAHKETVYSKYDPKKGVFKVREGVAEQGEIKRVDVFTKKGKFFFIPLYVADFVKDHLVEVDLKGNKIDETYSFKFSVQKGDYVAFQLNNKPLCEGYFNFIKANTQIEFVSHDGRVTDLKSAGSAKLFKKYSVDYFGNKKEILQEKRIGTIPMLREAKKAM